MGGQDKNTKLLNEPNPGFRYRIRPIRDLMSLFNQHYCPGVCRLLSKIDNNGAAKSRYYGLVLKQK